MSPRPDLGPKPRLGYTESRLERAAERRADAAAIAALAADRARRRLCDRRRTDRAARRQRRSTIRCSRSTKRARSAPSRETVFLGLLDGAARFGIGIAPAAAEALKARGDLVVTDLRSIAVQGLVDAEHLPPLAEAKAMLHWHARHRFCSNCGAPTQRGRRRLEARLPGLQGASIFRAPIRSSSCWRSTATAACSAARGRFAADHVVVPRRLRRAGRSDRGRGAARDAGGGRHRLRPRQIFRFAALAVPDVADDRLPRRGAEPTRSSSTARSSKTRAGSARTRCAAMLMRKHPDGLTTPPPVAIAHHIIRAWVERRGPL